MFPLSQIFAFQVYENFLTVAIYFRIVTQISIGNLELNLINRLTMNFQRRLPGLAKYPPFVHFLGFHFF